jgi:hypothetical protein
MRVLYVAIMNIDNNYQIISIFWCFFLIYVLLCAFQVASQIQKKSVQLTSVEPQQWTLVRIIFKMQFLLNQIIAKRI